MQSVLRGCSRAVVVDQLVEQSLMTTEVIGLNTNFGKVLSTNCNEIEKMKIKKNRLGMAHLKNEVVLYETLEKRFKNTVLKK